MANNIALFMALLLIAGVVIFAPVLMIVNQNSMHQNLDSSITGTEKPAYQVYMNQTDSWTYIASSLSFPSAMAILAIAFVVLLMGLIVVMRSRA